ncbi:hypothetical protein A2773_05430 [Candidatus Gottesmanbacteria bacterium RIFCSPHIGHO2_01_FULL_39_10]|uniref:Uncharacterized protein n=1 Tax=Candidatus Gottesmanbacteria bacterium RIFCSPHIGHO2_01_FULL_39_10 TaxID=1798375 RepID=A0A1F5ZQV7_9BACT|nr:MAG: hypothetical protein A2773_05430 [Candidatus Gottesmanbacteria bacterium RIFCSPHIGHO2_01_FULL_39_10]
MKHSKLIIFILILPLTLLLDFLLYASGAKCASCGSFWLFLSSESALSFPLIIALSGFFSHLSDKFVQTTHNT